MPATTTTIRKEKSKRTGGVVVGFDFEATMKVIDRRRAGILHVLNCALMAD